MSLITEERYWALFYMPLYTFIHNLLNVLVQTANKIGIKKNAKSALHVSDHKHYDYFLSFIPLKSLFFSSSSLLLFFNPFYSCFPSFFFLLYIKKSSSSLNLPFFCLFISFLSFCLSQSGILLPVFASTVILCSEHCKTHDLSQTYHDSWWVKPRFSFPFIPFSPFLVAYFIVIPHPNLSNGLLCFNGLLRELAITWMYGRCLRCSVADTKRIWCSTNFYFCRS
jgi:hypothetical protein